MTQPPSGPGDHRRVRLGLAVICLVVVVSLVLVTVVEGPVGKALMFAVAATAFVRAFLLVRWLRRNGVDDRL